jgi:uncharacterized coiled-coil protein SlyX
MTTEPKEANITEIEEVYRKFLRLYERFAAERLIISKQGETLGKIMDELKAETGLATEFKTHIRKDVVETLKETAIEISSQIRNSIQEPTINEINNSSKELKKAVDNSIDELHSSTNMEKKAHLWTLAALFGGALIALFILFKLYAPNAYFTSSQVATYKNGILLELFWDKLSKKEQAKLTAIANSKLPPEENSIKWIREHNPDISSLDVIKKFNAQP